MSLRSNWRSVYSGFYRRSVLGAVVLAVVAPLTLWAAIRTDAALELAPGERLITLLATNDIHGGVEPQVQNGVTLGGMAIWSGIVDSIRRGTANRFGNAGGVLVVDAGDQFQGTLISNYNEGQLVFATMNVVGYDMAVPGNHDYDFGPVGWLQDQVVPGWPDQNPRGALMKLASEARFPLVSASTYVKSSLHDDSGLAAHAQSDNCASPVKINWSQAQRPSFLLPYVIKNVAGVRVALIGLDNSGTAEATTPVNVSDLCFRDEAQTYLEVRSELEGKADVFVALVHDGNIMNETDATQLANALSGKVDAIISAHTHVIYSLTIGGVPVIQSGSGGTHFGRVDLVWDSDARHLVSAKTRQYAGVPMIYGQCGSSAQDFCEATAGGGVSYDGVPVVPSATIQNLIAQERAVIAPLADRVLGKAEGPITVDRVDESPMADALTDALRQLSGAEVAFMNTGGIRASIDPGTVTYENLFAVIPFNNHALNVGPMPAGQLLALLNRSIGTCGNYGALMQSGLRVKFRRTCGANGLADPNGTELLHVETLRGEVLLDTATGVVPSPGRTFLVATLDFLAAGGSGYAGFKAVPVVRDLGVLREAMTMWYLRDPVTLSPRLDGRWVQAATSLIQKRAKVLGER